MEKLQLNNFRCFTELEISFRKNVNLFIGDNSSGKSTLIAALTKVLNSFFIGFSDENTVFTGLSKNDFSIRENNNGLTNERPIVVNFSFQGVNATLELRSKKSRTLQTPLIPIYGIGQAMYQNMFNEDEKQVLSLPVFGSFSTKDIHTTRKTSPKKFRAYAQKPSFGYYECLQGDGFLSYWTKRLLVLREGNRGQTEIIGVVRALVDALGPEGCNILVDISIRPNQGEVYFIFTDGREINTDGLSDGYRRLVNIIMDIAFRCMLLNQGIHGERACKLTRGTVLIDEIDLHLHPSLQALVIKGFQNAFPLVQLIATTHAPLIMSGIPDDANNIIHKLSFDQQERNYSVKEMDLYGMDASTIMEIAQRTIPRDKTVDKNLKALFELIEDEHYDKAKEQLHKMQEEFGDNLPDLARANSMLDFLTDNE
ncbi:AAA family ATPase [Pedobacter sp. KBW01]|uniref:AAA family ATPase n=1 Tax=Pedobacter sp. KBW01 TaxID=2153364 RepID=UPI001319DD7A|nr:AAA family ATPase [Pedobacter sp. KBW01]